MRGSARAGVDKIRGTGREGGRDNDRDREKSKGVREKDVGRERGGDGRVILSSSLFHFRFQNNLHLHSAVVILTFVTLIGRVH